MKIVISVFVLLTNLVSNMQEQDQITIDNVKKRNAQFDFIVGLIFLGYYITAAAHIPINLSYEILSIVFYLYTLCCVEYFITVCFVLIYIIRYFGATMHKDRWRSMLFYNRYPYKYVRRVSLFIFVITNAIITIVFTIVPNNNNRCRIYSNDQGVCDAMFIAAYTGYIWFTCLIIILLIKCWEKCRRRNEHNIQENLLPHNNQPHTRAQILYDLITLTLPISSDPLKKNACSICYEDSKETDSWRELQCGHKFHPTCVDGWICAHNSCPMCRAVVINQV